MSYELIFKDLGRSKASGTAVIKDLTYKELNRVFKKYYMSELEFMTNEETGEGKICFGFYSNDFKFRKIEE